MTFILIAISIMSLAGLLISLTSYILQEKKSDFEIDKTIKKSNILEKFSDNDFIRLDFYNSAQLSA